MIDIDQEVRRSNPWWRGAQYLRGDPHLKEFRNASFQWDPPVLEGLRLDQPAIHTLRGPRQVGKTTTLKRILKRHLPDEGGSVGYFSFDLVDDPATVLEVVRSMRRQHPNPEGRWLFLFDEITQLEDWTRGVKYAWDQGLIRNDTLLLTGSSARDMVEGAELLPGRRGEDHDYVQLPMSFRSFVKQIADLQVDVPVVDPNNLLDDQAHPHIRQVALQLEDLNELLGTYLTCGGLPAPVRDWLRAGSVSERSLRSIWQAVAGDLSKRGLKRETGLKLIERVAISQASPFAWTAASRDMDVHPNTVKRYVRFLTLGFTLLPLYFWDLSEARFNKSKQRKIYFRDPIFAQIPRAARSTQRTIDDAALVEGAVAETLLRATPKPLLDTFPLPRAVGYWKSSSGREIDFLADPTEERLPIEVKWSDAKSSISNARKALGATFDKGLVLTRSIFEPNHTLPAIPVSVFLYLVSDGHRMLGRT
jgi:predicted AAA+ superfamily ATPase